MSFCWFCLAAAQNFNVMNCRGTDSGGVAVTATCVLTLTNAAPSVTNYATQTVVPASAASGKCIFSGTDKMGAS